MKVLLLLLFSIQSFAQNFEGRIFYSNSYKSKMGNPTSEQLSELMGNRQEYLLKKNNYKSITNGKVAQWQLYRGKENKMYYSMAGNASILWSDASSNQDSVFRSEINRKTDTILGYVCDELILTCRSGIQKYYFNSKFRVDPALFTIHRYGNWNTVMNLTQSIPLKMIIDNSQFTLISIATKISPEKLSDELFMLPPQASLEKAQE